LIPVGGSWSPVARPGAAKRILREQWESQGKTRQHTNEANRSDLHLNLQLNVGLLFGQLEIAFNVVVIPGAAECSVGEFTIDHIMDGSASTLRSRFHVHRSGRRVEGGLLESDSRSVGSSDGSGHVFTVKL